MESFAETNKKGPRKTLEEPQKRQIKTLHGFKQVLHQLVFLLRKASAADTAYLYWINRERQQFVLETKTTNANRAVFQDRTDFDDHFLSKFKNIRQLKVLEIGPDIAPDGINHYRESPPVQHITLLPFYNNNETVALTAVETDTLPKGTISEIYNAYTTALGKVLNTYLELSDLYENKQEWVVYEESLQFLEQKGHYVGLLKTMLDTMNKLVDRGGVSLISRAGSGQWVNMLNAQKAVCRLAAGISVEERSLAARAIDQGQPEFAIHFNRNPKRVSPREMHTEGATLAVPMMFDGICQGVVLAYNDNALIFSESLKHKLQNIVRLTSLKIQAKQKGDTGEFLLANEYGAVIPDCWERLIDIQISRFQHQAPAFHSWAGLVTPTKMAQIRTQFRLEQLHSLQKKLVRSINPNAFGLSGLVGLYTDYHYLIFLESKDPGALQHWSEAVKCKFKNTIRLSSGEQINAQLRMSFKELDGTEGDSYQLISTIKKNL